MANHGTPKSPELLGQSLKQLRETKKESLAEAAGAVEIDENHLARIESGHELPSEDILVMLFNHFSIDEQSASRLRQLAGYSETFDNPNSVLMKIPVIMLGIDQRVVYSDGVHIDISPNGVVLNFLQSSPNPGQPVVPVSRVGMSHSQAELLLKILEQAMLRAKYQGGPRQLPSSTTEKG